MIKKSFSHLFRTDTVDQTIRILFSWRLYIVGAFFGALVGWAFYSFSPPDYRAQATVIIDHNIEEAWIYFPDRELFHFLERETQKLEAVAWADETLTLITQQLEGFTIEELRDGLLVLSYPGDGPWHFYGVHSDPQIAQALAAVWAEAFAIQAWNGIQIAPELEAARNELEDLLAANPEMSWGQVGPFWSKIDALHEKSMGISSYIEISLSEVKDLPVSRSVSSSFYLLGGSILGVFTILFAGLFFMTPEVKND